MDTAKYIGLFLLKHKYAYLPGLGNLELKRQPAAYNGEALNAPQYTVVLTPGGSLDDALANFIAGHEQTSIAKASNNLREFAADTKKALEQGQEVIVPAIGKFVSNGGKVVFVADQSIDYTPQPMPATLFTDRPAQPEAPRATDPKPYEPAKPQVQWGKIILLTLLTIGVLTGGYFLIRVMMDKQAETGAATPPPATEPATTPMQDTTGAGSGTTPADTIAQSATAPATPAPGGYQIVLGTYSLKGDAERRAKKLGGTALGNSVTMLSRDSTHHLIVLPYTGSLADTARVVDSLGRLYGQPRTGKVYVSK